MKRLDHYWYAGSPWLWLLLPLSLLFRLLAALRRQAYHLGLKRSTRLPVPVIVVGNITVGGTGKTPLVAWLAGYLRAHGYSPGIVARGYGGTADHWPQRVTAGSDPAQVGDEAVLLAALTDCPLAVAPDRVAAGRALLADNEVDILISDDGLQHYALQRDIEIAVIDAERRFGNGLMLPAGPLREPPSRLTRVDLVVVNGAGRPGEHSMALQLGDARLLQDDRCTRPLADFRDEPVHAVAGIGHPARFFRALEAAGLQLQRHPMPDHHRFRADDIRFADGRAVLMTAKDAVKCRAFAPANAWFVPAEAQLPEGFQRALDSILDTRLQHRG